MNGVKSKLITLLAEQRGITGLETAIVLIAFVVVASVFAFTVLTTGIFTSQEAQKASESAVRTTESTLRKLGPFVAGGSCVPGGTCNQQSYTIDWSGCPGRDANNFPVDQGGTCHAHAQLFRFKLAPAGNRPVDFDPTKTIITWFDTGGRIGDPPVGGRLNLEKQLTRLDGPYQCITNSTWCYRWQEGQEDQVLDPGEYVEIFIGGVGGFLHPVEKNSRIVVEVITADGAVMEIQGLMPGVVQQIMSLDR